MSSQGAWARLWWAQEAVHFLDYVLTEDRDFRDVLSGQVQVFMSTPPSAD